MSDLLAQGHVVLGDLKFPTGSSELDGTGAESLSLLSVLLNGNESYRVVLVGHTDSVGALEDNLSLSRRRAAAVRQVLIDQYGVDPEQVDADGVGYLAPLGSNLTEEGRRANRRVEAVLLYR
jgi:OOP family OmpA-OmpF porin